MMRLIFERVQGCAFVCLSAEGGKTEKNHFNQTSLGKHGETVAGIW